MGRPWACGWPQVPGVQKQDMRLGGFGAALVRHEGDTEPMMAIHDAAMIGLDALW